MDQKLGHDVRGYGVQTETVSLVKSNSTLSREYESHESGKRDALGWLWTQAGGS